MALSDHVRFEAITTAFNLSPDQIKKYMKAHLAPGSYRAWRKRVSNFSKQREFYK
ncbi:MAG: TIGR03643 family protein [Burkholderiaceae bacterium]|nr:TIGR03643 family protein [Burkholderiaceae bacterium]MDP5127585.1 TIGR03643 family protein [Burkholderiaceae bacterium]